MTPQHGSGEAATRQIPAIAFFENVVSGSLSEGRMPHSTLEWTAEWTARELRPVYHYHQ